MRLSIVIPVHNGGDQLRRCIDALLDSTSLPDEILIADDASSDGVPEALAAQHGPLVRLVPGPAAATGPAGARNRAATIATGDVLVFVDADVAVHADSIAGLTSPFTADPKLDATFGSYDDRPDWPTPVSRYANLRHHYVHQHADPDAETFWSGFGAVRRDVFLKSGGFRESFTNPAIEDIDFGMHLARLGHRIRMIPSAEVTHLKRWTLRSHLKSDIFRRAMPWSRAIAERGRLPSSLNASWHERACAAAAVGSLASIPVALALPSAWLATAALLIGWIALNAGFLRVLGRHGVPTLLVGTTLHFAYHVYSTGILVATLTLRNRSTRTVPISRRIRWLSTLTAWGVAGLLLVGAVGAGIGGLSDPDWLRATIETHAKAHLSELLGDRLGIIQTRATTVAVAYALLAAVVARWGPRVAARAAISLGKMLALLRRHARNHRPETVTVLLLTLSTLVIALLHANQPMRTDEAHSYLNYVTRPMPVALLWFSSANNHMLHSMLMNASGTVFGSEPWALRLPAVLAGVACVPLLSLAAGRMAGRRVGILVAAAFAGSAYWLEVITNARGYPIMIACMLAGIAAAPHASKGRWPGLMLVAIASAIGAWSNAMMLYPFAMLCGWIGLRAMRPSSIAITIRHTMRLAIAVVCTGVLVALFYSPAWVLLPEQGSGAQQVIEIQSQAAPATLVGRTAESMTAVWEQTIFGAGVRGEDLALAFAAVGIGIGAVRLPHVRLWLIAVPAGFAAVFTLTRFATPPWWSLSFLLPFVLVLLAIPLGRAAAVARIPAWPVALILFLALAANTHRSGYPDTFPRYNGEREAAAIVAALLKDNYDPRTDRIYCTDGSDSILNYYFFPTTGQREYVTRFIGTLPRGGRLYMYRGTDDVMGSSRVRVLTDYDVVDIRRFGSTELLTLRPDPDRFPVPDGSLGSDASEPAVDADDLPREP